MRPVAGISVMATLPLGLAGGLVLEIGVVEPLHAAEMLDGDCGHSFLDRVRILLHDAPHGRHPGACEVACREREHDRPVARALRQLREILRQRQNSHATVLFRRVRTVGVSVDDDDLVGAGAGKRGDQSVCRSVREGLRLEHNSIFGTGTRESLELLSAGFADIQSRDALRRTREGRVLIGRIGVGDIGPGDDHADSARLLELREIVDAAARWMHIIRKVRSRGIDAPRLIDRAEFAVIRLEIDQCDLALQAIELECSGAAGVNQFARHAGRRRFTGVREIRSDRGLERHPRGRCDRKLPAFRFPARERVMFALHIDAIARQILRQKLHELCVGGVARIFRAELRHPDLPVPDFLL